MNAETLRTAIAEAKRFISAAEKVGITKYVSDTDEEWESVPGYTKESAAAKRASMDLTRALAEMRKS